jgi:putative DNA primase/helicase
MTEVVARQAQAGEGTKLFALIAGDDYEGALVVVADLAELFAFDPEEDRSQGDRVREAVEYTIARRFDKAWANGAVVRSSFGKARREWIELEEVRRVNEAVAQETKAKPKPEAPVAEKAGLPAVIEEPQEEEAPEGEVRPGVLNPMAPLDNARMLVGLRHWRVGQRALQFWQGEFWQWNGKHWKPLDENTVNSKVYAFLDAAEKQPKPGWVKRFEPTQQDVNRTVHALKSHVNVEPEFAMPGWLGEAPVENLMELVAVQNGLLYMPTRELVPHTPRFWSPNVLEFKYDRGARAPRFEQFLEEVWPGDEGAQQGLLEWLGLCLTDETKYQKAFMFVGPTRGGRGTIGRVLRGLIGVENYVGTKLADFGERFGMESWIGKKVAVFSDARIDGVRRERLSVIAERLLNVTGEDAQSVPRKHIRDWNGVLRTRILFFGNELLRFQDESGALAGRFITWQMKQSFRGREDPSLTGKLLAERSGIMNLALDALDRLRQRGYLLQHATGVQMSENLGNLTSDILAFGGDRLDFGSELEVPVGVAFHKWKDWCTVKGIRHPWAEPQFSEKLCAAFPLIRRGRPRSGGPGRPTVLYGVGLRKVQVVKLER